MMEPSTQRIDNFVIAAGGWSSRILERRELRLDEVLAPGIAAVFVTVMNRGEPDSGGDQGTVSVTMLVTVLVMAVAAWDGVFA